MGRYPPFTGVADEENCANTDSVDRMISFRFPPYSFFVVVVGSAKVYHEYLAKVCKPFALFNFILFVHKE